MRTLGYILMLASCAAGGLLRDDFHDMPLIIVFGSYWYIALLIVLCYVAGWKMVLWSRRCIL